MVLNRNSGIPEFQNFENFSMSKKTRTKGGVLEFYLGPTVQTGKPSVHYLRLSTFFLALVALSPLADPH
mgnify:CR=1 FL=1